MSEARKNKFSTDWEKTVVAKPNFLGTKTFENYPLEEIREYIDWTPFFQTWQLKGKYPKIFEDPQKGEEAKKLFADAQVMLDKIVTEKLLQANAVMGIFPANAVGEDDVDLYSFSNNGKLEIDKSKNLAKLHFLRQQSKRSASVPNLALSDFIAPESTGKQDYIGGFAVTTGIGIEKITEAYEKDLDDYNSILVKALADRLAEAFAELMHAKVRKEYWGYVSDEKFQNDDLIRERYQGIRPAPGYPACPDHLEKKTLWEVLDVEKNTGIKLTESFAMYPASSVSGWYFAHPDSKYFGLGKIEKDQVEDYAKRKGMTIEEIERWLAPVLAYDV